MNKTWYLKANEKVFDFEHALAANGGRFVDWRMSYDQCFKKGDIVEIDMNRAHKNIYVMQVVEVDLSEENSNNSELFWPDKEVYYDGYGRHKYARLHLIRHEYDSVKDILLNNQDKEELLEGTARRVETNRYERNRDAREKCLSLKGFCCQVCGLNFEEVYGEIGRGFIHVHHVVPISSIGENYVIDPSKDLVPVCPNCHNMLHRKDPPYMIEELKEMIQKRRWRLTTEKDE